MPRLLIVDDSPTQASEVQFILESEGFDAHVARDAEQGIERLEASRYDLVISDVLMPGASGYEFCRMIRARRDTAGMPVVLLTTLGDPTDIIQGLTCGADAFITKPFEPAHLVARVRNILENKRLRAQGKLRAGVDIFFFGKSFEVASNKEQILDLLVSSFEETARANRELRASEARLATALADLERKNEALLRAQRQRRDLMSFIVHDLKNPLAGILANAQFVVRDRASSPGAREAAEGIVASARALNRMVLDLLDIERNEDGALEARRSDVDVAAVVAEICAAAARRAEQEQRRIEATVDLGGRLARVDPDLVRRLIENLIDNALRYARELVCVQARFEGQDLVIRVVDDGPGVPEEFREKIFEKYVQLDPGKAMQGRSSRGLGLVFCRLAAETHGGRIWIEDLPAGGACFVVRLPAAAAPEIEH